MNTPRANRRKKKTSGLNKIPLPIWLLVGGAILVLGALLVGLNTNKPAETQSTGGTNGAPALQVDQEVIDFGEVPVNQTVYAEFKLSNVGDQPLRFSEQPYIEVVEGC